MNKNVGEPISFLFHVNSSFPFELSKIICQNFDLTTPKHNRHSFFPRDFLRFDTGNGQIENNPRSNLTAPFPPHFRRILETIRPFMRLVGH